MNLAGTWIRAVAATALLTMAAPLGPASADHGFPGVTCDIADHADAAVLPIGQDARQGPGLAEHDIPICQAGCSHLAGPGCCGSVVVATPSSVVTISTARDLPSEADQSHSGVDPDAPEEPPQFFA